MPMVTTWQINKPKIKKSILYFRIIRILLYTITIIALIVIPLEYIQGRSFCIFYNAFSIKCPGCGLTRAFFNMVHLNITAAINYNKLIIFIFPTICFIAFYDIYWILSRKNQLNFIEKIIFQPTYS